MISWLAGSFVQERIYSCSERLNIFFSEVFSFDHKIMIPECCEQHLQIKFFAWGVLWALGRRACDFGTIFSPPLSEFPGSVPVAIPFTCSLLSFVPSFVALTLVVSSMGLNILFNEVKYIN